MKVLIISKKYIKSLKTKYCLERTFEEGQSVNVNGFDLSSKDTLIIKHYDCEFRGNKFDLVITDLKGNDRKWFDIVPCLIRDDNQVSENQVIDLKEVLECFSK